MPGPPKKPTVLKLREGNPGRRKLNAREPKPAPGMPSCPNFLAAEAKKEWKRLAPRLERMGLLTEEDRNQLAGYCQSWADYRAAVMDIAKRGRTFLSPKGHITKNPMLTIMNEAWTRMHKASARFGFDPASRSGIAVGEKSATDDFEEFLNRNVADG